MRKRKEIKEYLLIPSGEDLTCETCRLAQITKGFQDNNGIEILRHCPHRENSFIYDTKKICIHHTEIKTVEE